jgi:AcrR family transcriptional regulator
VRTDHKADILDAFIRLVSRFGVDKTTMQDVVKETGLSIGMIYSDFKNKEDLIEAYIDSMGRKLVDRYRLLLDEDLPPERLLHRFITGMFENTCTIVQEDRGLCQFMQGSETIKVLHKTSAKRKRLTEELDKMVETIMVCGIREDVFTIEDIPKTARLFLKAFEIYWKDFFLFQDPERTLRGVEEMYAFLIEAILNRDLKSKII